MPELTPPKLTLPKPRQEDPRLFELFGKALSTGRPAKMVIIGFPCDLGVARNGGRLGAAEAPDAIRNLLYRFTPDAQNAAEYIELVKNCRDLGNLVVGSDLEKAQAELGAVIAPHLANGSAVIILGGGHETSYGHFLGYVEAKKKAVRILNWDAHPDLRPLTEGKGHSGSPFRQACEHPSGYCKSYSAAGLLPHSCSESHLQLLRQIGGNLWFSEQINKVTINEIYRSVAPEMVSFDLDALDQAYAPGVSTPAAGGLSPDVWLHAA
ncbi:MAG: arginase [Proteobacteria bacterium]|nr:MAG: arginase [Pseudomonadota bacterium]